MKLNKITALILALIMMLSLCACGGKAGVESAPEPKLEDKVEENSAASAEDNSNAELIVTDMIGREIEVVPGSYSRVVCIGAGALRMYSYVCDVELLCGVEDIDNASLSDRPKMFDSVARPYVLAYSAVFETLPSCGVGGPNAQTAEAEKILSCNPDIVISEYEDVEKSDALQEQLGVPVITLKTGPNGIFDDAFSDSLKLLGTVFGTEDRAETLVEFVGDQIREISDRTSAVSDADKPSVYICGLGNWGTTNHLMTSENFKSFDIANVSNAVSGLGIKGVGAIEEEYFVSIGDNMDIMIIDAAAVKNIQPLYAEDSTMFDSCKAWQTGEVYLQMAYNAYYTNYEISLINTWFIAKSVYPDLFADVDMTEKTDEISSAFLGTGLADEIFACPSSFGGYGKIDTATFFG